MCIPCKVVIDGGFVAAAADLLAETVGSDHPLHAPARYLASVVRADVAGITLGMQIGTIKLADVPKHWDGCHRATEIMAWVGAVRRQYAGHALSPNETQRLDAAVVQLEEWAEDDYQAALAIVAGAGT